MFLLHSNRRVVGWGGTMESAADKEWTQKVPCKLFSFDLNFLVLLNVAVVSLSHFSYSAPPPSSAILAAYYSHLLQVRKGKELSQQQWLLKLSTDSSNRHSMLQH